MRYAALALGLLVVLFLVWSATRKPLSIDEELKKLDTAERQALDALLTGAGLAAGQLMPVGLGAVEYSTLHRHTRAIAIDKGHVTGLRLADVPLKNLEPLSAFSGLRALLLNGNQLTSLQSIAGLKTLELLDLGRNQLRDARPLSSLSALKILRLSQNELSSIDGISSLQALVELDISNNKITDVTALSSLPALKTVDISQNPISKLPTPIPDRWNLKKDAAQAGAVRTASRPPNWVAERPATKKLAATKHMSHSETLSGDVWKSSFEVLKGAEGVSGMSAGSSAVTLELSVEKGRVRAYLQHCPEGPGRCDGFVYADAAPEKPATLKGYFVATLTMSNDNTESGFIVESLDPEAQGLSFKVTR